MSYQTEREEFVNIMGSYRINVTTARALLREATVLQRLAELACSSERADKDTVPCLGDFAGTPGRCLCRDYGTHTEDPDDDSGEHGRVPRYMVREHRAAGRVNRICSRAAVRMSADFQGDPRGAVLAVSVNGGRSIAVPSRGYSAAQLERMG